MMSAVSQNRHIERFRENGVDPASLLTKIQSISCGETPKKENFRLISRNVRPRRSTGKPVYRQARRSRKDAKRCWIRFQRIRCPDYGFAAFYLLVDRASKSSLFRSLV
jgi:hypothetical protein